MLNHFVHLYGWIGLLIFGICLVSFIKDTTTPKTDVQSWLVIAIATGAWPIVLPISLLSLLVKHWKQQEINRILQSGDYSDLEVSCPLKSGVSLTSQQQSSGYPSSPRCPQCTPKELP